MSSQNSFWDFSLAVYRIPGVAAACLRLQDEAGVDVNLLLYVCWLGTVRDRPLDEAALRDALAQTDAWRDRVVRPLREVRRWMKGRTEGLPSGAVESLRSDVKRIELAAERLQQDMLFAIVGPVTVHATGAAGAADRVEKNIALYLRVIGTDRSDAIDADCRIVAAAAVSA